MDDNWCLWQQTLKWRDLNEECLRGQDTKVSSIEVHSMFCDGGNRNETEERSAHMRTVGLVIGWAKKGIEERKKERTRMASTWWRSSIVSPFIESFFARRRLEAVCTSLVLCLWLLWRLTPLMCDALNSDSCFWFDDENGLHLSCERRSPCVTRVFVVALNNLKMRIPLWVTEKFWNSIVCHAEQRRTLRC